MPKQKLRSSFLYSSLLVMLVGCRVGTDLHVWQPPLAADGIGKRVAISPLVGPGTLPTQMTQMIASQQPALPQQSELVSQYELSQSDAIALVSHEDRSPSDLALLPVARRARVDYLLVGEVLNDPSSGRAQPLSFDDPAIQAKLGEILKEQQDNQILALSWRVIDVETGQTVWANPMSVSKSFIDETYPDLSDRTQSLSQQLQAAAGRETWKLLMPFVDQYQVELAVPWVTLGAGKTRQGNQYAQAGDWQQAESCWREALSDHPRQAAAVHNLALAAVARQDYPAAKQLATEALSRRDSRLFQKTLVWIDARQREYHAAFDLPDPAGGWKYPAPQTRRADRPNADLSASHATVPY